jgi:aldehyde:ferredoxin oxidoreductase
MAVNSILGYNGKILRVNLSRKEIAAEQIDDRFCRSYLGGAGFIAYYLWKELKPGIDALSPDNKLIFALGPVTGLLLPGSGRNCIGAKSPLTGGIGKAEAGGFWAAELKRAGYDAIIIEGRAETPVYLWIHNGKAEIRDARHLWGKNTKETQDYIRDELGDDKIQFTLIGPAGENQVRYACIMHGLNNAAARCGHGAVMGSKNLKAIAVRGNRLPQIADTAYIKSVRQKVLATPHWFSLLGTGGPEMIEQEAIGNLPVCNFRDGLFPPVHDIHGGVIKDTVRVGMEGCFACPVRCKKLVQFDEPYHVDAAYGGPEYESIAALGTNCGIGNLKAILKGNELCNAYSLDAISTGNVIAFAMESFEKGLLSIKDTGGIELKFGNHEAMLEMIELIARRKGIGNLLAEGTARVSRKIGGESSEFALHVKGLEFAMHEPRLSAGYALTNMVNPQGGDHTNSMIDFISLSDQLISKLHHLGVFESLPSDELNPRKVAIARLVQFKRIIEDSMVVCMFLDYSLNEEAELIAAATGWDTGSIELMSIAERIITLSRLFNIQQGFSAKDDVLPDRFFKPKTNGVLADKHLVKADIEKAKMYYYSLMGWDMEGVPRKEKVEELNIR